MRTGRTLLEPGDLNLAEQELVKCAMTGTWWEAPDVSFGSKTSSDPQDEKCIRAQVIYQLVTGHGELCVDDNGKIMSVRAVRVLGATISDHFDLEGAIFRCPMELVGCRFNFKDAPILLKDATAPYIRLSRSVFVRGVNARNLTIRGDLDCTGIKALQLIDMSRARIGGSVVLRGARVGATGLRLDDAEIVGSLHLDSDFKALGEVMMSGIQLGRSLELSGGSFLNRGGRCLVVDRAEIRGAVFARSAFVAEGLVGFEGATVNGAIVLNGATINNEGDIALNLALSTLGGLQCKTGFVAYGTIDLSRARVMGTVSFDGGGVYAGGGISVNADGANIEGAAFFRSGFRSEGQLRLLGAAVGNQLSFDGGVFINPGQEAIAADHLEVGGSLHFRSGARAEGVVRLWGSKIEGSLELNGATIEVPTLYALILEQAEVKGAARCQPKKIVGHVSLKAASVEVLIDNKNFRSLEIQQDGLKYESLLPEPPSVSVTERLAVIAADPAGYATQPYSQLARIYRDKGHADAARRVLIESQKVRRRQKSGLLGCVSKVWSAVFRYTTGYGYRPWLAAGWIIPILVVGAVAVGALRSASPADFERTNGAPDFNSILYTVDMTVPFVDLGYSKWVAHGMAQLVSIGLIILGWVAATMLVSAFTAILRRGD